MIPHSHTKEKLLFVSEHFRHGARQPYSSFDDYIDAMIDAVENHGEDLDDMIRLVFPELNEERRKELTKEVKKSGEEIKVSMRNIRREANDFIKKLEEKIIKLKSINN